MASPDVPSAKAAVPSPLATVTGGARLAVKLTPKASRNKIEGIAAGANGQGELKVSVTAVPENGKANAALIALLAKSWKIAKGTITITAGTTDRHKVLFIEGDADELGRRLAESTRTS